MAIRSVGTAEGAREALVVAGCSSFMRLVGVEVRAGVFAAEGEAPFVAVVVVEVTTGA